MSDVTVQRAQAKIAAAEAEAESWRAFLQRYLELNPQLAVPEDGVSNSLLRLNLAPALAVTASLMATGKMSITETVARSVIASVGRPVPTLEMLKHMAERHVDVGGKDPASTLAARLSRAPSLKFSRGLGWALQNAPTPMNEAADPAVPAGEPAASDTTPNNAAMRGEAEHHNMTR